MITFIPLWRLVLSWFRPKSKEPSLEERGYYQLPNGDWWHKDFDEDED